ncbi:MAG TPA: ATP-binding protein, partial [Tepidisphaeraceae bacterium]|nr:ATP-binding protein [Tepidisphaeraceae bacterium]
KREDGGARICIADTGSGIEETELKRYGEAFFTGYDVTRHSSGTYEHGRRGLGLGASVVKKFVDMHGGKVEVKSAVGQGTSATIMLPDKKD